MTFGVCFAFAKRKFMVEEFFHAELGKAANFQSIKPFHSV